MFDVNELEDAADDSDNDRAVDRNRQTRKEVKPKDIAFKEDYQDKSQKQRDQR